MRKHQGDAGQETVGLGQGCEEGAGTLALPERPTPFSPVHNARKFSAVLGHTCRQPWRPSEYDPALSGDRCERVLRHRLREEAHDDLAGSLAANAYRKEDTL